MTVNTVLRSPSYRRRCSASTVQGSTHLLISRFPSQSYQALIPLYLSSLPARTRCQSGISAAMSALCVFSLESGLSSLMVSLLRSPCTLSEPHLLIDTRYYSVQVQILTASSWEELETLLPEIEAVIVIPQENHRELQAISNTSLDEDSIRLIISTKATAELIIHVCI